MRIHLPGVIAGAMLIVATVGCRSAHYQGYIPPGQGTYAPSARVLGLPILGNGTNLTAESRAEMEARIDSGLTNVWASRYTPIAQIRRKQPELMKEWVGQMAGSYDLSVRLAVHSNLCRRVMESSGCRYAVLPTYGACSVSRATELNIMYVIPAGPMVIYGSVPIFIGEYPGGRIPASTLQIIDLQAGKVMSEEHFAAYKEFDDPLAKEFPPVLLRGVGGISRRLQTKEVVNEGK